MDTPCYPCILRSRKAIAVMMGVGEKTVDLWLEKGAPIVVEGVGNRARYSAELAALQKWRLEQNRKERQANACIKNGACKND